MATKTPNECPTSCSGGCICRFLSRIGLCRSTLVTLALVPFAWDGVEWFVNSIRSLFDLVSGVGG